jgi:SOS-response transcriptional repressor LexA
MTVIQLQKKENTGEQSWLVHNIKRLMAAKGLNEATLAKKTSIPQPTLHKILSGKTADPRVSTLKLISEFFNISLDAVIYTPPHEQFDLAINGVRRQTKHIPVISWQQAVDATSFLTTLAPSNWEDWQIATVKSEQVISLVSKISMEPRFSKGTLLMLDLNAKPIDGDLVVVHYPNTDEATLRQLFLDGPVKRLNSLNQEHDGDILDDNIRILGVVIQATRVLHDN